MRASGQEILCYWKQSHVSARMNNDNNNNNNNNNNDNDKDNDNDHDNDNDNDNDNGDNNIIVETLFVFLNVQL